MTYEYAMLPEQDEDGRWVVTQKQTDPATLDPAVPFAWFTDREAAADYVAWKNG